MGLIDCDPVLFTYDISVFGRKVDWYLTLRGFRYTKCLQPNRMPRPDLERLGISYRRIPILAMGRDVYIDSRLIIEELEKSFPEHHLGSDHAYEQALESVMHSWITEGGPFWRTAALIPTDVGVMLEKEWTDDRTSMTGRPFNRDVLAAGRADAYSHMINNFAMLEHGLLADGRKFIFATDHPTLVDVHTVWLFDWAIGESMHMGEKLDPDFISEEHFPRVYAWIKRFREAIAEAQKKMEPSEILSSDEAIQQILKSGYWAKEMMVDELDPLKLKKGQMVSVYPIDNSSYCKDKGRLVSLCKREVVIESKVKDGDGYLRLHFPRHNFKIDLIEESGVTTISE